MALNSTADVLDEGNWQADAWSPRVADDTEFQTWVGQVLDRANKWLQWRVGATNYAAAANQDILTEAEMQYSQHLLCLSAAKIAGTSDHPQSAPWLSDAATLRHLADEHKQLAEELIQGLDVTVSPHNTAQRGPYFKAVRTTDPVIERFDPNEGADDDPFDND